MLQCTCIAQSLNTHEVNNQSACLVSGDVAQRYHTRCHYLLEPVAPIPPYGNEQRDTQRKDSSFERYPRQLIKEAYLMPGLPKVYEGSKISLTAKFRIQHRKYQLTVFQVIA